MIQQNWDDSIQIGVVNLSRKIIPQGEWQHDVQDGNGDSHLKAAPVGSNETIPIVKGKLGLSHWQNIFFANVMVPGQSDLYFALS